MARTRDMIATAPRGGQMRQRFVLAMLAYILPTFPLGYAWHLATFKSYYDSLQVYRDDIVIPFGLLSMLVQSIVWAYLYSRLFAGEPVWRGAAKFAALAAPLAWSFMVIAVGAKHHMASVSGFVLIETAFILVQYLMVSPLIALVYRRTEP
jgi:riboflavin transporter FmnP